MMNKPRFDSVSDETTDPAGQAASNSLDSMQKADDCDALLNMQDLENIAGARSTEVNNLLREQERLKRSYSRPGISKSEADGILEKYNEAIQKLHDLGELKGI